MTTRAETRPPGSEETTEGPPLGERLSFLVHKINARLAQIATRLFRKHDIDLFSSRILVFLLERQEMRVGELVEAMALPQSTISHQLQRLEKRKFIKRRRTREDNRSVAVVLTPVGVEVARELNALSLAVYRAMIGGLSEADLAEGRRLLDTMFASLVDFRVPEDGDGVAAPAGDRAAL